MQIEIVKLSTIKDKRRFDFEAVVNFKPLQINGIDAVCLNDIVTQIKERTIPAKEYPDELINYISLENISAQSGTLAEFNPVKGEDVISSSVYFKRGDILFGRMRPYLNKVWLAEFDGLCTGEALVLRLINKKVNKHALHAILLSKFILSQIIPLQTGTSLPRVSASDVLNTLIPLLPSYSQNHIAAIMQEAYKQRSQKLAKVETLLKLIDSWVFATLNINLESVLEDTKFLKNKTEIQKNLNRFDVAFNMGFHKFDPYLEQVVKISDIVSFSKKTKNPTKEPDTIFRYIDISTINIITREIDEPSEILGRDAPSRARQLVHTGDILISTVRPTRGAIAIVPPQMDGFICSTGFVIIHPNEKISTEYLHTALCLNTTLEQFGRRSAGSSYPAILENDVRDTLIPLPTKEQQKEIADEITRRRAEARRLQTEAEQVVTEAKAKVEHIILGEEAA